MAAVISGQEVWTIGRWRFDAALGSLSDGSEVHRLELRAAATLAVLCRRRGEVVTRQELLGEVWQGRAVSPNSVAVVIADLRRHLGDDAKAPVLLLTLAKRGYRLAPEPIATAPVPTVPTQPRRRKWPILTGISALSAPSGLDSSWDRSPRAVRICASQASARSETILASRATQASRPPSMHC